MRDCLRGVRVLDLSRLLPGPYCAALLARLGASVTAVELPQFPDPARRLPPVRDGEGHLLRLLSRGKRRLRLDYSREPGRGRLLALLERADVLVEGFRPGLLDRLGLGPRELLRRRPRLVYASLTGFGRGEPRRAGHDLGYQAAAGLLWDGRLPAGQGADAAGALFAALGILAALRRRERTGRGGLVDVSLAASARALGLLRHSEAKLTRRAPAVMRRLFEGGDPFYRVYACRGGGRLAVAAHERGPAATLLGLMGLARLSPALDRPDRGGERLARALARAFLRRTRAQWTRRLAGKETCVEPVLDELESQALDLGGNLPVL